MRLFKKKKTEPSYLNDMKGFDYIRATRNYCDYLEEHLTNVSKAFTELTQACDGKEHWVADDFTWHTIREDVRLHDISKFSPQEFVQYRNHFFPTTSKDKESSGFSEAWENHKRENHHHHETCEDRLDVVHMLIDWMAMSYKFGDTPREYYEKITNSGELEISHDHRVYMEQLLRHLDNHRAKK